METNDFGPLMESVAHRVALRLRMLQFRMQSDRIRREHAIAVEASLRALDRSYAAMAKLKADTTES